MKSYLSKLVPVACLCLLPMSGALAANLISDGGFEQPTAGPGGLNSGYLLYHVGDTINGVWSVVGSSVGNVAISPSSEYTIGISNIVITFPSQEGSQFLDLTGTADNGGQTGVSQSFSTISGHLYSLSFYVGDINTPNWTPHQGNGIVNVLLNGSPFQTAVNSTFSGNTIAWQQFNYTFTAVGATTTLEFLNEVPFGVGNNGLDNVVVNDITVPEPQTWGLLAVGLGFLWTRKNVRATAV